jgi:xanthine/uracil/vitamin C permease (AzgA family)
LQTQTNFKRSVIAATAASSFIACLLMGIFANLPLALAPGMGVNAFFTCVLPAILCIDYHHCFTAIITSAA